jgi:hypothetical protein
MHLSIDRVANLDVSRRVIPMGSLENPLVRQYCVEAGVLASTQNIGPEGYILRASDTAVLIAGRDDQGAFYGIQSLRQLLVAKEKELQFRGALIRDWPDKPFRGIYIFLPSRGNIPFFKRFVCHFMALYNNLIVEMNACMRLDSHLELNSGWVQFARDVDYSVRNYPLGPFHDMEQNSSHQDTAGEGFLEKDEVADLVHWVRRNQASIS